MLDGAVGVALAASRRVAYESSDDKPWIRPSGVPAPPPPDCHATCAPLDKNRCEYTAGCAYDDGALACVSHVTAEPCPPPPDRPELFPCAAGVRFDVDASRDAGERVSNVEVNPGLAASGGGAWVAVDASATYVVVAPALVADVLSGTALPGYEVFNRTEVALSKTEVMSSDEFWVLTEARALAEHAESVETLAAPPVAEFAVKSYVAPDGVKHTRETFDDPWGTFEKECVYARPDAPGAPALPRRVHARRGQPVGRARGDGGAGGGGEARVVQRDVRAGGAERDDAPPRVRASAVLRRRRFAESPRRRAAERVLPRPGVVPGRGEPRRGGEREPRPRRRERSFRRGDDVGSLADSDGEGGV